jgi:hypothetical protein
MPALHRRPGTVCRCGPLLVFQLSRSQILQTADDAKVCSRHVEHSGKYSHFSGGLADLDGTLKAIFSG